MVVGADGVMILVRASGCVFGFLMGILSLVSDTDCLGVASYSAYSFNLMSLWMHFCFLIF